MKIIHVAIVSILIAGTSSVRADDVPSSLANFASADCAGVSTQRAVSTDSKEYLKQLARDAISADTTVSKRATELLRAAGPDGLQALLDEHTELWESRPLPLIATGNLPFNEQLIRLHTALDAVGQQRDCYASGLYWYTDFDQAKAAANATGKPILSLRLLGRLDEEFSCANSRFFRTTLYANKEVSAYLRDHFVLHWKSVRPVPKVTIDFGDGRKLERTITGNSIHYVLAVDGQPMDALPGLYGPQAFLAGLKRAEDATKEFVSRTDSDRKTFLKQYHNARLAAISAEWSADVAAISLSGDPSPSARHSPQNPISNIRPERNIAHQVVQDKNKFERPLPPVTAITLSVNRPRREADAEDSIWARIAARHRDNTKLDDGSKALMRSKNPTAFDAGRRAMTKMIVEDPLLRQIRNLERSISEDTVRNEYLLHATIHEWFANASAPRDVEKLNARVYAELFLTPDSDPWLGLMPRDSYTALENNGLIQTVKR